MKVLGLVVAALVSHLVGPAAFYTRRLLVTKAAELPDRGWDCGGDGVLLLAGFLPLYIFLKGKLCKFGLG